MFDECVFLFYTVLVNSVFTCSQSQPNYVVINIVLSLRSLANMKPNASFSHIWEQKRMYLNSLTRKGKQAISNFFPKHRRPAVYKELVCKAPERNAQVLVCSCIFVHMGVNYSKSLLKEESQCFDTSKTTAHADKHSKVHFYLDHVIRFPNQPHAVGNTLILIMKN